jgi:hypothetical protein
LVQRRHHVLEQAYDSLEAARQKLLGRIACFRRPVGYEGLKALGEEEAAEGTEGTKGTEGTTKTPRRSIPKFFRWVLAAFCSKEAAPTQGAAPANLQGDLRDLVAPGLLHRDLKTNRFDLHPIVRRYAYDRLAAPDRDAAHARLRDYFAAVPEPEKVTSLDDLAPVIELYHHTVRTGQYDEAFTIFRGRIDNPTFYQLGAYQLQIELLRAVFADGEDRTPRLKDESHRAEVLNDLANSYSLSGQPRGGAVRARHRHMREAGRQG